jgi:hypothetical protein
MKINIFVYFCPKRKVGQDKACATLNCANSISEGFDIEMASKPHKNGLAHFFDLGGRNSKIKCIQL